MQPVAPLAAPLVTNARMYTVDAASKAAWRTLLEWIVRRAGLDWPVIDHGAPTPIAELWARADLGAAMMCGLPFALARPQPTLVAAPIPSPGRYAGRAVYCTDVIVRADSRFRRLEDTFGGRAGFTVPDSQSGCVAFRRLLARYRTGDQPLYREVAGPLVTPRRVIEAVAAGEIDVGPVDGYAHDLLRHLQPSLTAEVRVVASTPFTPIPAFVATAALDAESLTRLRLAFAAAIDATELAPARATVLLAGFAFPDPADYDALAAALPEAEAHPGIW